MGDGKKVRLQGHKQKNRANMNKLSKIHVSLAKKYMKNPKEGKMVRFAWPMHGY